MSKTMNYSTFKSYVCDHIHSCLPDHFQNGSVKVSKVCEAGEEPLDSLIIEEPGCLVSPSIILEDYYASYASGMPIDLVMDDIASYRTEFHESDEFVLDPLMRKPGAVKQFEKVKDKIVPRLINYESNRSYLEDKAFKLIEDLAVTYHVYVSFRDGTYSTAVTRDMLRDYHIGIEQLHVIALENIEHVTPMWFRALDTLVAEAIAEQGQDDRETMQKLDLDMAADGTVRDDGTIVLSNASRRYGAAIMLVPEVMDRMRRLYGKDFYILPSSVHEVILRPRNKVDNIQALRWVVKEINRTVVEKEERLSDNIYTYDFEKHMLKICREK
ncbi:MAG: hypothetical protein IKE56_03215 [Lachnospiraceae bacterium]|nr:hypothetical protein [Lachnospiraceae bacterium]